MTRPRTTIVVATLAVLALLAGAAVPAAANHDHTDADASTTDALFGTTNTSEDAGLLTQLQAVRDGVLGYASGTVERAEYQYAPWGPEPDDAETSAGDAMQAFNARNDSFVAYANDRGVAGDEVAEITFAQNGDEETVYLVADYNSTAGEYESVEMVNTTDRSVDETVRLEGMAADQAADEIEAFHGEFVEPGEDPDAQWLSKRWQMYNEDLESSLIDGGDV